MRLGLMLGYWMSGPEDPIDLVREAEELGYRIKEDYADRCHLCQEARQVLRPKSPEFLAPEEHYVL